MPDKKLAAQVAVRAVRVVVIVFVGMFGWRLLYGIADSSAMTLLHMDTLMVAAFLLGLWGIGILSGQRRWWYWLLLVFPAVIVAREMLRRGDDSLNLVSDIASNIDKPAVLSIAGAFALGFLIGWLFVKIRTYPTTTPTGAG